MGVDGQRESVHAGALGRGALATDPQVRGVSSHRHDRGALAGFAAPSAAGAHLGLYSTVKHAVVGYSDALREADIGVSLLLPHRVKGNWAANSARSFALATGDESGVGEVHPPTGELTSAHEAGPLIVAAIRRRQRYVLTRPADLTTIEERYRELRDAASRSSLRP